MSLVRRLGAVLKMGIVWGIAWIPLTFVSVTVLSLWSHRLPPLFLLRDATIAGGLIGAVSGMLFGGLLALGERQRTVASLSARRVALWGALAALIPPGLALAAITARVHEPWFFMMPMIARILGLTGVLGAACAGGVLYVARRAPALPGDSPGGGARDLLP